MVQQDECARLKRRTHLSEVDAGPEVGFTLSAAQTSASEECSDRAGVFSVRGSSACPGSRDQARASKEVGPQDRSGPVSELQLLHPPVRQKHFNAFATLGQQQTG